MPTAATAPEATWEAYVAGGRRDDAMREQLLSKALPRLEALAQRIAAHTGADPGDMLSAGALGLIDAARRYTPGQGSRFWTYARNRCHGAMRDWLRQQDHLSRVTRIRVTAREAAAEEFAAEHGHRPDDEQLADRLGWSEKQLKASLVPENIPGDVRVQGDGEYLGAVRDQLAWSDDAPGRDFEFDSTFREATRSLPMLEAVLIYLCAVHGTPTDTAAAAFGFSRARVDQLLKSGLGKLRESMTAAAG